MIDQAQLAQIRDGKGFIAALDQSGGSTPKALRLYGIEDEAYTNDDEMFALIHQMRSRIVTAPAFTGDKVVGAILFEMTMDREIGGTPAAAALWNTHGVVPFLKVDKGLMDPHDGVQLMKPIDGMDTLLARATASGMFGTKMRSVIAEANPKGIQAIVAQQFEIGKQILSHGLIPVLEPEISITMADKTIAEEMLLTEISEQLAELPNDQQVMLKLTLPEKANHYLPLVQHPQVLRVVALSGGYARHEANTRLSQNAGIIASFSRALTEGLSVRQSDAEFNATLAATIDSIYDASVSG
jgi:fructose-bisphosphate aldolase class I